jgi:hypothetical protein
MLGIAFAAITENGKNNELICTHRERGLLIKLVM